MHVPVLHKPPPLNGSWHHSPQQQLSSQSWMPNGSTHGHQANEQVKPAAENSHWLARKSSKSKRGDKSKQSKTSDGKNGKTSSSTASNVENNVKANAPGQDWRSEEEEGA
eukprot:971112-Pyramimonas_sp.AAC.1